MTRLKSLELVGYKTFASKTLFEFGEKITAIVGPNGSGKSNIADALRWVLGEQTYSMLRGRKTEDMIFSGSEQRARAGMASAALLFDNTSGWLPIDYSEVGINRRAYRDGSNEYLVNGQKVRLKDVNEILGRTGLAEQTYTIIGQGLVDRVLSLKPEERRALFEDAAGIGLYRSRRDEALRRLEATRRNLDRVEDILAELRPRLKSLERQARRTLEYQQVRTDLLVLLREWYGYHWRRDQLDLTRSRENARQQDAALQAARTEQTRLSAQSTALRDRIHRLRSQVNAWHRELAELHNQWEAASRESAVAQERQRATLERRSRVEAELSQLDQEVALNQERLIQAQAEVEALAGQVNEARSQVNAGREALAQRRAQRSAAIKALEEARSRLEALNNRRIQVEVRQGEAQNRLAHDENALAEAEQALKTAENALRKTVQQVEITQTGVSQAIVGRTQAEEMLKTHREQMSGMETQTRSERAARDELERTQARLQAQLEVLDQAEQSLAGYADGARWLLEAARKGKLSGVLGAFSSQLDVPAAYETPIAAVLGEAVDAVLLEAAQAVETTAPLKDGIALPSALVIQALTLLEQSEARATLLPLAYLAPPEPLSEDLLTHPGCLGIASRLVKTGPKFRPVVDLLLGRVLVVQNRQAAISVLPLLSPGARVVTLKAEVFYAEGQVSAGGMLPGAGSAAANSSRRTAASTLGRQRQRRELSEALKQNRSALQMAAQKLENLASEYQALQSVEKQLQTSLDTARRQENEARAALRFAQESQAGAERQRDWQRKQVENLRQGIQQSQLRLRELADQRSSMDGESEKANQQVREYTAELANLPLDELETNLRHWETQFAVANRAVEDANRRRGEREQLFAANTDRRATRRQQLADLERDLAAMQAAREKNRTESAALDEQIGALQTLIQPGESELAALEQEQEIHGLAEAEAIKSLAIAERAASSAQLAFSRAQESLDTLRSRIEEDFGLVEFVYEDEIVGQSPLPMGTMVERLPVVKELAPDLGENIKRMRAQLRRMEPVNFEAQKEYEEVNERHTFLVEQVADLEKAEVSIKEIIGELDMVMEITFRKTFEAVAREFREFFTRLFGGGSARLVLTLPDDMTSTGVDIDARLPGKRSQGLALLSGGERSLTATALVFSLIKVSSVPFCVLDEVDAMLDEANVNRFADVLRELSQTTQFIVITHNRNTVQVADVIYGVTMGRDSTSQVLSLRMDEVEERLKA